MKGLSIASAGAPYELVSNIEKPTPGPNQILVKSIYAGINPVETLMQGSGVMIRSWPAVIGCDASGIVVEIGEGVTKFKKGDAVFGCTRLGSVGYSTFQEYFLMDEHLTFLKPENISMEEAATIGVGILTAGLGLVPGMGMSLPKKGDFPKFDEYVIVLGGSGAVGQFAIQLAKRCGYKVVATCSPTNEALVKSVGADATVSYKLEQASQLAQIESITGGNFFGVLDTTAYSTASALDFLQKGSKSDHKRFSTVDDWSPIDIPASVIDYRISLGGIGQTDEKGPQTSKDIAGLIPNLKEYLEEGSIKPLEVQLAGKGFEAVPDAIKLNDAGNKGGRKIVVEVQNA